MSDFGPMVPTNSRGVLTDSSRHRAIGRTGPPREHLANVTFRRPRQADAEVTAPTTVVADSFSPKKLSRSGLPVLSAASATGPSNVSRTSIDRGRSSGLLSKPWNERIDDVLQQITIVLFLDE